MSKFSIYLKNLIEAVVNLSHLSLEVLKPNAPLYIKR